MDSSFSNNKEKLIQNLSFLCENTSNLSRLTNVLISKEILSLNDSEIIMGQITSHGKNDVFYKEISKKMTNRNFMTLLEALRATNNEHVADVLEGKFSVNVDEIVKLKSTMSEYSNICLSSKRHRLFPNKWWPEEKMIVNSFVERYNGEDLIIEKLKDNLEAGSTKKIVITQKTVVCGLGGIGKSTTAKWFANKYSQDYDHIVWIDCEGSVLNTSIRRLAKQLNIDQNLGPNLPIRPIEDIFRDIENELSTYTSLFIYDNAEEYTGQMGIKNILPKSKSIQCIITSRNQSWGSDEGFGSIPIYHLEVFTLQEALNFFKMALSGKKKTADELLKQLAKDLGYLPLALQHAVAAIKSIPRMTVKKYIEKIQEQKELYRFIQLDKLDDYEKSIFATFSITLNQLRKMEPDGQAAVDILYVCAFFRPDDIPTSIFEAEGAFCLLDQYSMVGNYKIIEEDEDDTSDDDDENDNDEIYVTMHRLLQQVIFLQVHRDNHVIQTLDKAVDALSKCQNAGYHGEAVWDYIEKNMELIQRYSNFPYIVLKIQGYLDADVQEKFLQSLISVKDVPNNKDVIDFIALYANQNCSDDNKLGSLVGVLEKVLEPLKTNTTMEEMTKDMYLLAVRYNLVKLLIRLGRANESVEIVSVLSAHAIKNCSGRVWTTKRTKDQSYIFTTFDVYPDSVIVGEWEEFPKTYGKPPDILKIGCMVYKQLRDLGKAKCSTLDKECSTVIENLMGLLPSYNSNWLEKTFQGILYYHKADFEKSFCSFIEGVETIKINTNSIVRKSYFGCFSVYRLILKEYLDLVEKANKWDTLIELLLDIYNLVTDFDLTKLENGSGMLYGLNNFGLIFEKMCTNYQKYHNCAIVLEKLFLVMNKFPCLVNAKQSCARHFLWMADIAERSAECYVKNGEYSSAIEVWGNVCRRLKSIPQSFNAFKEIGNYPARTKLETFGNDLINTMRDKELYTELKFIEHESEAVKKYFK